VKELVYGIVSSFVLAALSTLALAVGLWLA